MKTTARSPVPRTPEEYLDALEDRSRRRIAGGLFSLHRRGEAELGPGWSVALALCGGLAAVVGWRWLTRPRVSVGGPDLRIDQLFALGRGLLH